MLDCFNCRSKKCDETDADHSPRPHAPGRKSNASQGRVLAPKPGKVSDRKKPHSDSTLSEEKTKPTTSGGGEEKSKGGLETPADSGIKSNVEPKDSSLSPLKIDTPKSADGDEKTGVNETLEISIADSSSQGQKKSEKRNLWIVAEKELDQKVRKWLHAGHTKPIEQVLNEIQSETEDEYRKTKNGATEVGQISDRKKKAGEVSKKILIFTLQAQDLIKAVASFDPTGHASTAWSLVSFGLTLIKHDIERRDAVMEACEFLAGELSYLAIVDGKYRPQSFESTPGLEDALIEIYVAILKYAAEMEKAKQENWGSRARESIRAFVETPLQDLKTTIRDKSGVVRKWKELVQDEVQSRKAEDILNTLNEQVIKELKEASSRSRSQEELDILDWLSRVNPSNIQNDHRDMCSPGTGKWVLEKDVYVGWKARPGSLLWLRGAVGCGKSVLCSTVIDDIEKHCDIDASSCIAYWYFRFSFEETKFVQNTIRSLIRQLAPHPLPDSLFKVWKNHQKGREPSYMDLQSILDGIVSQLPAQVFIIFDALDECPYQPIQDQRTKLLKFMDQLIQKHSDKLHLLATSRPEPDITSRLDNYSTLDLEYSLGQDVKIYVQEELKDGILSRWNAYDPIIHQKIQERLLGGKELRFRWAELQIKRLQECHLVEQMNDALESLPDSLEDSYRDILVKIDPKCQPAAKTILTWLSFSLEPVSTDLVAEAANLPFADSVMQICTTLLVTSSPDNIIRLAHFSVKEFLVSELAQFAGRGFYLSAELAHREILERILLELHKHHAYRKIDLDLLHSQKMTLFEYGAHFWGDHLAQFRRSTPPEDIQRLIDHIFLDRQCYLNWKTLEDRALTHARRYQVYHPRYFDPIYDASRFGLMKTVSRLLDIGEMPNKKGMTIPADVFRIQDEPFLICGKLGYLSILLILLGSEQRPASTPPILKEINHSREGIQMLEKVIDRLFEMELLTKRLPNSGTMIIPEVMEASILNKNSGVHLVDILSRRGAKYELDRSILDSLKDSMNPQLMLRTLLERKESGFKFSGDSLHDGGKIIASDLELANYCFHFLSSDAKPRRDLLWSLGLHATFEVFHAFIAFEKGELLLTNEILTSVAEICRDSNSFKLLLQTKSPQTEVSHSMLEAAAKNERDGLGILTEMLEECGSDYAVPDAIMCAAASNESFGLEMVLLLLDHSKGCYIVSEDTMCAAAENLQFAASMMKLFLSNRESDHAISDEVFCIVVEDDIRGIETFKILLDECGPDHKLSEDVMLHLVTCFRPAPRGSQGMGRSVSTRRGRQPNFLEELIQRNQPMVLSDEVIAAASKHLDIGTMKLLLATTGPEFRVTNEMLLESFSNRDISVAEYFLGLLGPDYTVTESFLEQAVSARGTSKELLANLLDKFPDSIVSEGLFLRAHFEPTFMEVILDRYTRDGHISEVPVQKIVREILEIPEEFNHFSMVTLKLLIDRGLVVVDHELLGICTKSEKALRILLAHRPKLVVTQQEFDKAETGPTIRVLVRFTNKEFTVTEEKLKSWLSFNFNMSSSYATDMALSDILSHLGSRVTITEDLLVWLAYSLVYKERVMMVLLEQERPLDLQKVWEALWTARCDYSERISDLLLDYTALEIPDRMLKAIRKKFHEEEVVPEPQKGESALKSIGKHYTRFLWYLMERNVPISQGPMAELILEKLQFGTINVFLDHNPHLKITPKLIDSALLNPDHYEIIWLLHHKAHQSNPQVNGIIELPSVISHPLPEPTCRSQDCDMLHHTLDRLRRSRLQEISE